MQFSCGFALRPQSESVRIVCHVIVRSAIKQASNVRRDARRPTERTEERWARHSTNGSETIPCNWRPYPNGFLLPPFDHFEKVTFLNNFNLIQAKHGFALDGHRAGAMSLHSLHTTQKRFVICSYRRMVSRKTPSILEPLRLNGSAANISSAISSCVRNCPSDITQLWSSLSSPLL
jgi:hypothetical protein